MDVTAKTLKELGAGSIPILYVMNKADKVMDEKLPVLRGESKIYLSAAQGEGIPELVKMIEDKLFAGFITMDLVIPYTEGQIENDLRERARVLETKYEEDGIHMKADLNQEMLKRYRVYLV
jgi:GTP-binding protein HflX